MENFTLSSNGTFPSVVWDDLGNRWVSAWQEGHFIVTNIGHSIDARGSETAFPRLYFEDKVLLAYRDGAHPFDGHLVSVGSSVNEIRNLKPIHGMFPVVMGNGCIAYQRDGSQAMYPIRRELINGTQGSDIRFGAPTGLAMILSTREVLTWDDIPVVDGLHNRTYAGFLSCGATDRNGAPCVVVVDQLGKELVLWAGMDSQNPTIAWDYEHGYAVVAWSSAGQGVRMATFLDTELSYPNRVPTIIKPTHSQFFGWFYEDGRYGEHSEISNVVIQGRTLYADGAGKLPANVNDLIVASVKEDGGGFIVKGDVRIVKSVWNLIFGVWLHEVGSPDNVRWAATDARAEMSREGVKARPIVAVISPTDALNSSFAGTCEILAPEIYFDEPATSWDAMYGLARTRVADVLAALSPTPVILIPQAYDRSDTRWQAHADQLTAIAQACFDVLNNDRVLGLWPFSFSRPGGAMTYPELLRWYELQAAEMERPPYFKDDNGNGGGNEEDMTYDELRGYMARLDDPLIFGALQRFHNEVLPRDRPVDPVKSAEGGPFNVADVVTGGAMAYFLRHYCIEAGIAQDKGRTPEQASGDAYDIAIKAYMNVANPQ